MDSLTDCGSQISEDFNQYSEDIKNKTETFKKYVEKCEIKSNESETILSRTFDMNEKETHTKNNLNKI